MATARITAKATYHDQRVWVMASKPPQLVCTQHPAPPCPPSLNAGSWPGLPVRLSINETYPLLLMRRSTPICQGAVGCLPGRLFRLHHIPRFAPPILPKKNSPTSLKRRRAAPTHWSKIRRLSSILSRSCSLGPSKTSWPFCCSCSIWSLMRSLSLSTEASIML